MNDKTPRDCIDEFINGLADKVLNDVRIKTIKDGHITDPDNDFTMQKSGKKEEIDKEGHDER